MPELPPIPDSVDNALRNLSDKPSKSIGDAFGDIFYLVFHSFTYAADRKRLEDKYNLQQYENELRQKLEQIPPDNLVPPSIQKTAQALENSKYCITSNILREMYIKLISGTMDKTIEPHVHPSFSEILKQMSEDDAKFIRIFKSPIKHLPLVDIQIGQPDGNYQIFASDVSLPYGDISSHACSIAVSSLQRFGLLRITYSESDAGDIYDEFKHLQIYHSANEVALASGLITTLKKGLCMVTPFGKNFLRACVPSSP